MTKFFHYSQSEFNALLSLFQKAIDSGEYTEKIPYETWRKLKKLSGLVEIECESSFVRIKNCSIRMDGIKTQDIIYSAKTYDWGFGRFFYDYVVKKENERMTSNSTTSAASACDTIKAEKTKANYMNDSNAAYTTSLAYDNDGYFRYGTDSTSAAKTAETNTIELNVPSLNYYGHQIDGTWDSVASKSEVEDRFNKLETELQKKVDKVEMKKENNTMMKGINFDIGPCGNTVRLSMYGMAIQNISGEWVSYNPDSREIINVDVFNMADGGKYMYKMPVAIADVKIGDIVIHNRVPMFVTAVNENGTFEVTDVRAGETKTVIPTRNMFGFNFMTKVVSLFGAFTNAPTADQPFGNMLPFLMLNSENGKDIDPMMMFFMMNQGGNGAMNPMMWYFVFKDNKEIDPAMMWMIMSMAMGATPSFMTGNYPKATVVPDAQATPNFVDGNCPNTTFISDVQK